MIKLENGTDGTTDDKGRTAATGGHAVSGIELKGNHCIGVLIESQQPSARGRIGEVAWTLPFCGEVCRRRKLAAVPDTEDGNVITASYGNAQRLPGRMEPDGGTTGSSCESGWQR